MVVRFNGAERDVPDDATVASVLAELDVPGGGRGVAVALEGEVVPRAEWARRALRPGDRIEVVTAVQGG